ncbi:hypothetical protein THRCLA_21610 [Thraustotheca clavata]|uniref:Uncharacterized protein n=1 Tax=Thraustotheca clavata TaxID=74557 RepID=A0A1V9ZVI0_9STRA|nr:hypothetical protein THRCLA_21610 [Thraustotheca clavata]
MSTNTSFYYIPTPPVVGGTQLPWRVQCCGLAMYQVDHEGSLLFLYRNSLEISTQVPVTSHIQRFDSSYSVDHYRVAYMGYFTTGEACWGLPWLLYPSKIQTLAPSHPIVQAEHQALTFAISAGLLLNGVQQYPIINITIAFNMWVICSLPSQLLLQFYGE